MWKVKWLPWPRPEVNIESVAPTDNAALVIPECLYVDTKGRKGAVSFPQIKLFRGFLDGH